MSHRRRHRAPDHPRLGVIRLTDSDCIGGGAHDMACMSDDTEDKAVPDAKAAPPKPMPKEIGGPKGPEPTRYGDWEVKGRCTDF
jgi:hypothetical protein